MINPITWWKKIRETRRRVLTEDALKHLHACEWQGRAATTDSLAGALRISPSAVVKLCTRMQTQGWVRSQAGALRITPEGEKLALQVIRAHRILEKYLADEARMPWDKLHAQADKLEHQRSLESIQELEAAMGYPAIDPHGDPIPTADGLVHRITSISLAEWQIDQPATIVHIEDEPAAVFSQIAAEGLRPGRRLKIIEKNADRIVFTDNNETYTLAPVVAANIFVTPSLKPPVLQSITRLTTLEPGANAIVWDLDNTLQGFTRRRMLDLGLTRGATIQALYKSFLGDPTAYRVRGSLIALRRDQAEAVLIQNHDNN